MNPINVLEIWKEESNHTIREMGRRIGVSYSHLFRVMHGSKNMKKEKWERVKEVRRLEQIIRCEPADVILVKYELEQLIDTY